jgi:hypothetical protein
MSPPATGPGITAGPGDPATLADATRKVQEHAYYMRVRPCAVAPPS